MNRREFIGSAATAGFAAMATTSPLRAMSASDRIRIGLIGAGSRGQQDLRDAIKLPGVECVAVADIYSRRRDEAKAIAPNAMMYEDPRRLLDRNDIDAVIVATPVFLHSKYLQDVLAAGKDVYCEKTMTWDIAEAVACRKAANVSSQVVQIGLQHESEGALEDARQWIQQGLVGKVTMVEAWMSRNTRHGEGEWRRPISPDCDAKHVNYPLFLNDRPHEAFNADHYMNWRLYWEFSGGNVTENMIHQIAWIITALDLKEPVAVSMMGGVFSEKDGRQVPDTISVTLEYANDLVVLWQSTFSNSRYGLGEHFLGRDGTIEHISGATDMVTGKYTCGINYYPEKLNRPDGIALKGEAAGVNHMQNWMDCIRARNKKTNAPVEIGYLSAIAAHMSNLSYRTKQRITLEEAMRAEQMY
jgi:predicted dehydrogenase